MGEMFNPIFDLMSDSAVFSLMWGGSDGKLGPISFITDIRRSAHLW